MNALYIELNALETDTQTDRESECLSSLHLPHKCEPRDRYVNSNCSDILVADSETGSNIELDVALAHLWAADILSRASTTARSAAVRREELKLSKYKEEKLPGILHQ